jgi:hypothetical protein
MKKWIALAVLCTSLAACTTTATKVAVKGAPKPAAGAQVMALQPDVQLALLTAAGMQEPRADWSQAAKANLTRELEGQLKAKAHGFKIVDPESVMGGRTGQLLRLNEAVGQSIIVFSYSGVTLPSKGKDFNWTLGDGVKALASEQGADYALFVNARGTYASGGRYATALGMAMLGVSVPLGHQQVLASLVDLKTGRVVWFNVVTAGPSADMREAEGASSLCASLLKDIPL